MLAQNFKSAAELEISEPQFNALRKTLVLLETGKLTHTKIPPLYDHPAKNFTGHFNMGGWKRITDCGSVCCIGGTAELIGNVEFKRQLGGALDNLFFPFAIQTNYRDITTAQAATALRSYLTCGDAKWHEAIA